MKNLISKIFKSGPKEKTEVKPYGTWTVVDRSMVNMYVENVRDLEFRLKEIQRRYG